jgi:hypothetical protein
MSHNRTVSCGYCATDGHNKRSCPSLKKLLHEWEISGDPYYQNRAKQMKHRNAGRTKRCSYCGQEGHTIRTCGSHKARVSAVSSDWLDARKEVARRMEKHQFGIGSLLRFETRRWSNTLCGYEDTTFLGMVMSIQYTAITTKSLSSSKNFYGEEPLQVKIVDNSGCHALGDIIPARLPRCLIDVGIDDNANDAEYRRRRLNVVRLLNGTKADIPAIMFDWKRLQKQVYTHLKEQNSLK